MTEAAASPLLTFEVLTLFPEAVQNFAAAGLLGKAIERELVAVHATNIREFTHDKHRSADDTPFGGGAGMVMKAEPVVSALESVEAARGRTHRVLVTPSAPRFDQRAAERLATHPRISLLCGRYEGIDDRVREHFVDDCFSLGDFILGGGEVAALAIIEAVSRLAEGVLGNPESIRTESFAGDANGVWLEHPQYTRPAEFRGHRVPDVLLGGDHAAIARWRFAESVRRTALLRPDLCEAPPITAPTEVQVAIPASAPPEAALASVLREHEVGALVLIGEDPSQLRLWIEALGGRVQIAMFRTVAQLRKRIRKHRSAEPRFVRASPAAFEPDGASSAVAIAALAQLAQLGPVDAAVVVLAGNLEIAALPLAEFTPAAPPSASAGAKTQGQRLATEPVIADASRPPQPLATQLGHALRALRGN